MKKTLLTVAVVISSIVGIAQCDPNAFDWGAETFGVSPNPALGETFVSGVVGEPYSDIVYVKAPSQISDIPGAPDLPVAIDSLSLDSITYVVGDVELNITELGLNVTCNNNNVSPIDCHFYAGGAYCGDISGVPNMSGIFPVKIYATGYFTFITAQSAQYTFEDYTIEILTTSVAETPAFELALNSSAPNPANNQTTISYELPQSSTVNIAVYNLLGEQVIVKSTSGKQGKNTYTINTEELKNGIYLYSITVGDKKLTKKLMVQH
jgi:hypothetical protein